MQSRTVALILLMLCLVLVGNSLAQIQKPKAESSPAQPTSSSEETPKIAKPSAAPAPVKSAEPRTDTRSTQPPAPMTNGTAPAPVQTTDPAAPAPVPLSGIAGFYAVQGTQAEVEVKSFAEDIYYVNCSQGWEGVGILEGHLYQGVFRYRKDAGAAKAGVMGQLLIDWSDSSQPAIQMTSTTGNLGSSRSRWTRIGAASERSRKELPRVERLGSEPSASPGAGRPAFGEYVYIEELPEAITKIPPEYPPSARAARIEGVVQLQALVVEDGTVADVKIMKGVSGLDEAATTAVRQWRFKPALAKGRPVAVWVAVPVRFSLN